MDFNKTTQKQLTEIDKQLLLGFKTTSNLHRSLASGFPKKKPTHPALLFSNGKTKEYLEQARQEQAIKAKDNTSKEKFLLESDVKSLSSNPKMESNPRTESMIARQKESRRKRHITFLNEFEKVIETLYKTTETNCKGIKQEIEIFFQQSDLAINKYLDSLTDGELLTRELDFIDDLNQTIRKHQEKRSEKLFSLFSLLQGQETERQNTISVLCERLQEDLLETAFILEPEVMVLIREKTLNLDKDTQEFCSQNKDHLEIFNRIQSETFEKFEEMSHLKELRWRLLKHDEGLRNFRTDIQDMNYVNPPERIKLYQELKTQHVSFFKQREQYLKKLQELDFSALNRRVMEKWLEEYQSFVEKTDKAYDKIFDNLLKEHESTQERARRRLNELNLRLESVKAEISLPLTEVIEQECEPFLKKLNEFGSKLYAEAAKFIEESDSKLNDVITNLANLLIKVAGKFDDHKKDVANYTQAYELEKAKLADNNDDKLEVLNQEFEGLKVELQRAVHHPMLEENLKKVFDKIDDLEREYRDFHSKNVELAKGHPKMIGDYFLNFERTYAQFFELVEMNRKDELQQRNLKRCAKDS